MQVILQGSLRHFPPAELLAFLLNRGQSGTLDLENGGTRARVLFERQNIIWAEATHSPDSLEAAVEALQWTSGDFTLLDSLSMPDGAERVSLQLPALLEESKQRAEIAAIYPADAVFRVVENPAAGQLSLTADDLRLLFRLTSDRTFGELAAEQAVSRRDLALRLQSLEKLGLVRVARPGGPQESAPLSAPAENPFAAETNDSGAEPTAPAPKIARKPTIIGSLTPEVAGEGVHPLLDPEQSIGRTPGNTIVIPDASVSSQHARILRTPDGFFIEDLKSRNGTFVNGEKVTDKRLLADGDLIRVGKIIMTFNVAREAGGVETTSPDIRG